MKSDSSSPPAQPRVTKRKTLDVDTNGSESLRVPHQSDLTPVKHARDSSHSAWDANADSEDSVQSNDGDTEAAPQQVLYSSLCVIH